ncbi:hypothetical protein C7974DRAFT_182211 [Boeremia exigua]|uniref:uncharacterized protein n=1 Tax=Boeremia exigua TaxID=749465 RepID=UPI001E8CD541|nr:uncharacterized protein C7974DRAFT_182211 [Boeremia exigua]KAH6629157.1 hypothetical protein C7974DRAFT_182211 [Boeremia exigua]
MGEHSKGKQRAQLSKPSPLRNVQQVPDSDTVVPETQLEAIDHSSDVDMLPDDIALLKRSAARRLESITTPPLPAFGITKPTSAVDVVPPSVFSCARWATNKLPRKTVESKPDHVVHEDTAILSIETTGNGEFKQDVSAKPTGAQDHPVGLFHAASVTPPTLPSPEIPGPDADLVSEVGVGSTRGESQESSPAEIATAGDQGSAPTDHIFSKHVLSNGIAGQSTLKCAPITKRERNANKAKRGRRILLSGSLRPWPPRQDPAHGGSNATSMTETADHKRKIGRASPLCGDLAVKSQFEAIPRLPDGPCNDEVPAFNREAVVADNTVAEAEASTKHCVTDSACPSQDSAPRYHTQMDEPTVESIDVADSAGTSEEGSSQSFHVGHDSMRRGSDCSLLVSQPTATSLDQVKTRREKLNLSSRDREEPCGQAISLGEVADHLVPTHNPLSQSVDTQDVLHRVSDRSGTIRVAKSPKEARKAHDHQPLTLGWAAESSAASRVTALDTSLKTLRNIFLADQHRMEDRMASVTKELKEEKAQLQRTISEQLITNTELHFKLQAAEHRLMRIREKAISDQRYVAGLQKDHERMKKSVVEFQERNAQDLQDKVAGAATEWEVLQSELEKTLALSAQAQKAMRATMQESQLQYCKALLREEQLKTQLDERTSMYNEERARRVELEKQLLPSIQNVQRQLNESSASHLDKLEGLRADLEGRAAETNTDQCVEECLLILKRLDSLPLLTSNDVRKAEGMLRFLHERSDAGHELLAKISEAKLFPIDIIQRILQDQLKDLYARNLRHEQTIADDQQAQETIQSLRLELDTQTKDLQKLEEDIDTLRRSETKLTQSTKANEDRLLCCQSDLHSVQEATKQQARGRLEKEQEFCKYRANAIAYFNDLNGHIDQMTLQVRAKGVECDELRRNAANLEVELELARTKNSQLDIEISEYKATVETLRQDNHSAIEKEGHARALLKSKEEAELRCEEKNQLLQVEIDGFCTKILESKGIETTLLAERADLQRQLDKLRNNMNAQLQQAQQDAAVRSQQMRTDHTTELSGLEARLNLSEHARKELQSKLRDTEAAHKLQLQYHMEKTDAKFKYLVSETEREKEKLIGKHSREMDECRRNATISDKTVERYRSKPANATESSILVPNTQQPNELDRPASSSQGRNRKKVDRQTTTPIGVPSGTSRLDCGDKTSDTDKARSAPSHHKRILESANYFAEEYENTFGSQALPHSQATHIPVIGSEAEVIPETQSLERTNEAVTQFENVESQLCVDGDVEHEETDSELSNIPSEDLSEMLLDTRPTSERGRAKATCPAPSKLMVRTPDRSVQQDNWETSSTSSQGRPKSRANTASRMMPLPARGAQRQRIQNNENSQRVMMVLSERNPERNFDQDNNDSRDLMHVQNEMSKRTYADHLSVLNATLESDVGEFASSANEEVSSKKRRLTAQHPQSTPINYGPFTPAPTGKTDRSAVYPASASAAGRRSSNATSATSGAQSGDRRLSTARNTRSKTNRYADRFGQELDSR